jgi:hypothetical protein
MITKTRLESAHLAGNLLGDRSERDVFVYLPPGVTNPMAGFPPRICCRPNSGYSVSRA